MLQYLFNLTAIWLICLLVYDLFLRKETYHTYNRLYLNISILLGIALPFWSWSGDSLIYSNEYSKPITDQAVALKENVIAVSESDIILNWQQVLWGIYLVGATIALIQFIREVFRITTLYKRGKKSNDGVWTIIETGKDHSPFSAFRMVFVSDRQNYTNEEIKLIFIHEQQHGHLLHFIDLLYINIVKIVFWFHPLVYLIEKRLLMVHEYQADSAVKDNPNEYSKFLVEQSLLQPAPILSHSFIRSPLKSRIHMLTKRSGRLAAGKKLIMIPLLLITALCFTKFNFVFGQRVVEGNKISYKGNVFLKMEAEADTIMIQNPVSGEIEIRIAKREGPIAKVNSKEIIHQYYHNNAQPVEITKAKNKIKAAISNAIANELSQMQRMKDLESTTFNYMIGQVVIDEKGHVIYYELRNPYAVKPSNDFNTPSSRIELSEDLSQRIEQKIASVLQDINTDIMKNNGVATPYVFQVSESITIN